MTPRRFDTAAWNLVVMGALSLAVAGCPSKPDSSSVDTTATREEDEHDDGEDLNRVTLSAVAYRTAGIRVEAVSDAPGPAGNEDLEVPGQVEFDPRRVALISPRTAGRIERLTVVEGDRVREGQTVALLSSPQHVTAQNDFVQALRRARLLAGTPDEPGAHSIAEAARRRLRTLGVPNADILRLEGGGEPASHLALTAPFAGSIMESHALSGAAVEAGEEIFRIADLSVVDVVAEVPEPALPLVRIGQGASVAIAAYPAMRFAGQVERLRGELNPETRTVQAVIHVSNSTRRLRPGMFATVRLLVPAATVARATSESGVAGDGARLLTIPETAIVSDGERRYVFVEVGERTFERREVRVASLAPPGSATPAADRVAVRSGVVAGDRVVVSGAFVLKSELAKAGLGEHGH